MEEFRGFALADELAPLIFINGADSKAPQMFTLAHELAICGWGRVVFPIPKQAACPNNAQSAGANAVAAELLMPLQATREATGPTCR